jgi:hypothetical protein
MKLAYKKNIFLEYDCRKHKITVADVALHETFKIENT